VEDVWNERVPDHDLGLSREVKLSDMMRFDGGTVVGSRNVPHNSPMWRKRLHCVVGPFALNASFQPGCLDYSLWLRALHSGRKIFHVNYPLEFFVMRKASHGHTTHTSHATHHGEEWMNLCDPPNLWNQYKSRALHEIIHDL